MPEPLTSTGRLGRVAVQVGALRTTCPLVPNDMATPLVSPDNGEHDVLLPRAVTTLGVSP